MDPEIQMIAVDSETAALVHKRASAQGLTAAQLIAALLHRDETADDVEELERRWVAVESGGATVPHDNVRQWLETWGTSGFRAWSETR